MSLGFCLSLKQRSELEQECSQAKPNRQFATAKLPPGEAGQAVGRPLQPPRQPERPPRSIPGALFPKSGQRPSPETKASCGSPFPAMLLAASPLMNFPGGSEGKASSLSAGDLGSIPGSGRSPGEGNGNQLQYSCPENPMDGGAWWATVHGVAKSRTRLSDDFTFTFYEPRGVLESERHGFQP